MPALLEPRRSLEILIALSSLSRPPVKRQTVVEATDRRHFDVDASRRHEIPRGAGVRIEPGQRLKGELVMQVVRPVRIELLVDHYDRRPPLRHPRHLAQSRLRIAVPVDPADVKHPIELMVLE